MVMESPSPVVSPSMPSPAAGHILRLVVRFCDKKFMVVVPFNATFMDVKNEVLRVYRGINPSMTASNDLRSVDCRVNNEASHHLSVEIRFAISLQHEGGAYCEKVGGFILKRKPYRVQPDLCISELRDYSGCILFDEYQVGLLVRDLTKIIALRPGEECSCSTVINTPIPSRSSTPLSQTTMQEHLLTTPTHSLLHGSLSLKPDGKLSGYPQTTCTSRDGTQMKQATSNAMVPTDLTSSLYVATDIGGIQQVDQPTAKVKNTRRPTDSIVLEGEHSVLGQSSFEEFTADDHLVHKELRSSSLSIAEVSNAGKRDVYSYISSSEDGSSVFNANAEPKIPLNKKKTRRALPKKHGFQHRIEDIACTSISHERNKVKSSGTTTYREEAGSKSQSVSLRYPGYSSGWSTSDSETTCACNMDNVISTQTTNGDQKEKSDDQFSAPNSINSTISTSSWTSSERENQSHPAPGNGLNRQFESGHGVDSQIHGDDSIASNHLSDSGGIDVNNVKDQVHVPLANVVPGPIEQESPASIASIVSGSNEQSPASADVDEQDSPTYIISGHNEQDSPAGSDHNEQDSPGDISSLNGQEPVPPVNEGNTPSTHESTTLALDSVDLEMESKIHNNTGEPQQLEGPVTSQLEVTVIPETQEILTDSTSTESVAQLPGSPVIPLQNKDPALPYCLHRPVNVMTGGIVRTGMQPSFSDVDSYVLDSMASDTSEDQAKDNVRTRLLGKAKKRHSRYAYMHSNVGDSSESGGSHSCVRRRKAKLISRMFDTSHLNKHPYRRGLSRANVKSHTVRSDSEFIHPSPHQLASASLSFCKRKSLKLRIKNSGASKTESDDQKNQQKEISMREPQSIHSEDKPLVEEKTKQKPSEADSGISSTNSVSEIAPSPSTSDTQQNPESHTMIKKSKSKKRVSREVINISSGSESAEFEPPPFKKRKPRPNYSHQRKQKPTLIDEVYSTTETTSATKLNVDAHNTTGAGKRTSTSLGTPKVDRDSGVSTQQPLTEGSVHLKSSDTTVAEENTTDAMQHIAPVNYSEQTLQSTTERELSKTIGRPKSESSDSSISDGDEGMKSDSIKISMKKDLDYDMSQKLENCSASSSSDDSIDGTKFQGTIGIAPGTHGQPSEGSKVKKDGPSSFRSEQEETLSKTKRATSLEWQPVPTLSHVDSAQGGSKQDVSDSSDDAVMEKTAIPAQQPICICGDTKNQIRESASRSARSTKKSSLQITSSVHRPPRFLFSKSTLKKNYSQQLTELKNPPEEDDQNSSASESDDSSWSSSEEETETSKRTGSLRMLTPKGQLGSKTTGTAVKSSAQASRSQRRFSSDKPVRMFSLTPSIFNKKRNSPIKKITTQSPSVSQKSTTSVLKEKASDSEKLGYHASSLSQQEVLLAEGGSHKLSELLSDDKLWKDIKS